VPLARAQQGSACAIGAAFDAVDYLMDRLKTEAAFWKREHGPGGARDALLA